MLLLLLAEVSDLTQVSKEFVGGRGPTKVNLDKVDIRDGMSLYYCRSWLMSNGLTRRKEAIVLFDRVRVILIVVFVGFGCGVVIPYQEAFFPPSSSSPSLLCTIEE